MPAIAAAELCFSWEIGDLMSDMADLARIPGTLIEVPTFVMDEGGEWYSVPGHATTPKRKWWHARLDGIACATDDDGINLNFDFVRFCSIRDAAKEVWRLPACLGGCNWCWGYRWQSYDPSFADDIADQMPVQDTCDYNWWVPVEQGLSIYVPHEDSKKTTLTLEALPWTDFIVR